MPELPEVERIKRELHFGVEVHSRLGERQQMDRLTNRLACRFNTDSKVRSLSSAQINEGLARRIGMSVVL